MEVKVILDSDSQNEAHTIMQQKAPEEYSGVLQDETPNILRKRWKYIIGN